MNLVLDDRYFPLLLDVVDEGVFTVDPSGHITSFNRAAEAITGYKKEDVLGKECSHVFRSDLCDTQCPLRSSITSGKNIRNREVRIHAKDGRQIPIAISTSPLVSEGGKLLGGVEVFRDLCHVVDLQRKLDGQYQFEDIVSRNPKMHEIFKILPLVAESDSTILITGPSGSGKELLAKAIHRHGPRRRRPFVAVNCAAIPETLLESELFGYRKGAFTDARRDRLGRIAQAEGGTLFLDEIGDLPGAVQIKLLRFLQERTYEALGSNTTVHANVRVITATHRDLEAKVAEGAFRKDLFYRLNVLVIALPALRDRSEDVPLLARHFVQRFRQATGKAIEGFSEEAMAAMLRHDFPGNIRELENLVERAFILSDGPLIGLQHLPERLQPKANPASQNAATSNGGLTQIEKEAISEALARHDGNRTRAAKELGIHRTTLLRKMHSYGLGQSPEAEKSAAKKPKAHSPW
jgi:PAS domain S-box-containing protein